MLPLRDASGQDDKRLVGSPVPLPPRGVLCKFACLSELVAGDEPTTMFSGICGQLRDCAEFAGDGWSGSGVCLRTDLSLNHAPKTMVAILVKLPAKGWEREVAVGGGLGTKVMSE